MTRFRGATAHLQGQLGLVGRGRGQVRSRLAIGLELLAHHAAEHLLVDLEDLHVEGALVVVGGRGGRGHGLGMQPDGDEDRL